MCNLLGISPASGYWMPTFRNTLSVPPSKAGYEVWSMVEVYHTSHFISSLWRWNRQSVPKRRHSIIRRRGSTQKITHNTQNTVKVWNQVYWLRDAPTGLTFKNLTLCPHCICVFCIYLRTNSGLCHLQHKLIGFYNRDEKCLQRGTDWVFNP